MFRRGGWLLGLCLLWSCGGDDEVPAGPPGVGGDGVGGGVGGGGGAGASNPAADLVVGVPNLDDDDEDGSRDWTEPPFAEDDDLVSFSLPESWLAAGDTVVLELEGDASFVRFWLDGEVVLGAVTEQQVLPTVTLPVGQASQAFQIEFGDFQRTCSLSVGSGAEPSALRLQSAPLITNHHLQPAEQVWAVQAGQNGDLLDLLESLLGDRFTLVQNPDIWIQDELEWATATAPDTRLDIAMDSIRDRELDAYVKSLRAPDVEPMTWGIDGTAATEDKFGNLECTPPHRAGGIEYPFGRIYYGDNGEVGPNEILKDFLAAQQVQAPLELDVGWLCVGHVDEFLTFIPDPSSEKGFKLLFADVDAAYDLLAAMPPATSLPRYDAGYGYATVAEILADASLQAINDDVQADYLDPILAQLTAELELDPTDIVRVPSLFERIPLCAYSDAFLEVAALIPGLVNLTVVNVEGEGIHLVVPDPFLRSNLADPSSDPLIAAFRAAMPPGVDVSFVDDWYTYHMAMGEVHCGTQVARTPTASWWTDALHLLGGS